MNNNNNGDFFKTSLSPKTQKNLYEFHEFLEHVQCWQEDQQNNNNNNNNSSSSFNNNNNNYKLNSEKPHKKEEQESKENIEKGIELLSTFMDFESQEQIQKEEEEQNSNLKITKSSSINNKSLREHVAVKPIVPADQYNVRVNVGIDKDLEMILEMDPSIIDLVGVADSTKLKTINNNSYDNNNNNNYNSLLLPPIKGGWVTHYK